MNFQLSSISTKLNLHDLFSDFDVVSLYSEALSEKKSIYPRINTGFAFTKHMNGEVVEKFNSGIFTRGSAILKIKYYNPKTLIVKGLPDKEKLNQNEINQKRIGYIVDVLTTVDIREIVKLDAKVNEN